MPKGVAGEICVTGIGLAKGYLNRPELTAEKFVRCPFEKDARMYRTGDLGRWLPDGNIEFLGRIDDQVKVRGHRIEPAEIEAALAENKAIQQAVVVANQHMDGTQYLTAYFVEKKHVKLRPSLSEYLLLDDLAYHSLTTDLKRNDYYRKTFKKYLKDKTVLDIGTGPEAILSKLSIEAGAKKVYAVELSREVYLKAKQHIQKSGLADRIVLIHGDITQVNLPEKVDYCISEIVGSIGGAEGAAKLINKSRRLLKNPKNMIPKRGLTKIAAVHFPDELHQYMFDDVAQHYLMIWDTNST